MTLTVTIPTLETERLILRAPQMSDVDGYIAFKTSERAKFTGGPIDAQKAASQFFSISGQWVQRGYGLFMATLKTAPNTSIGGVGIFHPIHQNEPEFGWTLYDAAFEGKGYVTEAMRAIIPWAWPVMGVDTAQSHIDEGNTPSEAVAKRLGAALDPAETKIANAPGGEMHAHPAHVNIWRHHKGAMT